MENDCDKLRSPGGEVKVTDFNDAVERSVRIRECYHQLERQYHEKEWSVEEDALAFLSDAGLVGRLTMSQQGRWPTDADSLPELEHKLGECIWWLMVLAKRMNIDIGAALGMFLSKTESNLGSE
jgi:NTP pyrophosphatase (non-canonical NTP hydrolase)